MKEMKKSNLQDIREIHTNQLHFYTKLKPTTIKNSTHNRKKSNNNFRKGDFCQGSKF